LRRTIYFENLDALRAFAALSVIFFHITVWLKFPKTSFCQAAAKLISQNGVGGPMGVTFFFILSGFLITYLMFFEKEKYRRFSIKDFYIRRVLRIWPLYFFSLAIGFFIYPLLLGFFQNGYTHNSSFLLYSLFLANFDNIKTTADNGLLGVQWSVAIEEQFYLIWPLIFVFSNKKIFPFIASLILFFSLLFYGLTYTDWKIAYYHTASQFSYLSFGAILAWLSFFYIAKVEFFFRYISKLIIILIYVCGCLLVFYQKELFGIHQVISAMVRISVMLFLGFIIMEQNFSKNSFVKVGNFRLLSWLGKISYGLYLLHMVAIYLVLQLFNNNPNLIVVESFLVLLMTILLSYLSYQYLEKYFLRLKEKFSHLK